VLIVEKTINKGNFMDNQEQLQNAVKDIQSGYASFLSGFANISKVNASDVIKAREEGGDVQEQAAEGHVRLKRFQQESVQKNLPSFVAGLESVSGDEEALRQAIIKNQDKATIKEGLGEFVSSLSWAYNQGKQQK
jgi:hypothetical protein